MRLRVTVMMIFAGLLHGQTNPPEPVFGMIGVGAYQTLRLGIVAGGEGPCTAVLGFRDPRGMPLGGGDKRVDLAAHHADFHDFAPALVRGRVEARPVVQVLGGACFPSAAVFERFTGRTTVHAGKHRTSQGGHGDIHFAPVGGAPGQRLRMGVVCVVTARVDPRCRGEMVFHDGRGVEFGAAVRFDLGPGEAAFRDLSIDGRQRREIIPCVRPAALGGLEGTVGSVQVVENLTDWTTGYIIPCI